jgi:TetR/AcrR family tetracycline transcriptional repressor
MPQPPRIRRADVVKTTIELLNERGLDGVSLRVIADRLGVRQPALYHHFASKAALLDEVVEAILSRHHTARLPEPDEDWRSFLLRNASSLRSAMLSVRDGARLISSSGGRVPSLGNALAQVAVLERGGFEPDAAILALIAVSRYTIGAALEEQAAADAGPMKVPLDGADETVLRFAAALSQVNEAGSAHEFECGLRALVRGLEDARTMASGEPA